MTKHRVLIRCGLCALAFIGVQFQAIAAEDDSSWARKDRYDSPGTINPEDYYAGSPFTMKAANGEDIRAQYGDYSGFTNEGTRGRLSKQVAKNRSTDYEFKSVRGKKSSEPGA